MKDYAERVYAGILGKMIGVYAGRPVEGWSYEHITSKFDRITDYVNASVGMPLHVPDDDMSGTFAFLRTVEDAGADATARDFGENWLNYLIENRTVFWWGGMGRSTEHTAYLRLKSGVEAPHSGSAALNGQAVAEQIGALIFIDGFALICPGDAERARHYARLSASVSHDGLAVEAACFWVTLESLAFGCKPVDALLSTALQADWSPRLRELVDSVRGECATKADWRQVRTWLDERYGYHLYPGNCHVVPNFALMLAALLLGGDDFSAALEIVISSGWDTDCNAGNLCCLNGVRLGADAIPERWRGPLHDRFYCITSLGGRCTDDAENETRRVLVAHALVYGEQPPATGARYSFSLKGSTQGFSHCPIAEGSEAPARNLNREGGPDGLALETANLPVALSVPTAFDPADRYGGYELLGSPTLYEGQLLRCRVRPLQGPVTVRLYVVSAEGGLCFAPAETVGGECELCWCIPCLHGDPIRRVGLQLLTAHSAVQLCSLDWRGAPEQLLLDGVLRREEDGGARPAFEAFTSSAKQFQVDKVHTFCVSHPEENGVADFGEESWRDYSFGARVIPSLNSRCGLVFRTHGHRKYYAAVLENGVRLSLLRRDGAEETVLASVPFAYLIDTPLMLRVSCMGDTLTATADDAAISARDGRFAGGGAGFVVSRGAMLADQIELYAKEEQRHA